VALFLVVFVCTTGGWFFFRGPGRSLFGSATPPKSKENPVAVIADAPRPATEEEAKTSAPPREKPVIKPAPPPLPVPAPLPVPLPRPAPLSQPPVSNIVARTFDRDVRPIFAARCFSCHGDPKKKAGLDVRTVAAMLRGSVNGPILKPGDPSKSLLWESIATNQMPPSANKLSAAERKIVQEWIAAGAK